MGRERTSRIETMGAPRGEHDREERRAPARLATCGATAFLVLSVLAACNALTGVSDLEARDCPQCLGLDGSGADGGLDALVEGGRDAAADGPVPGSPGTLDP